MHAESYLRLIRGEARGPASALSRAGLSLAAAAYRPVVSVRNLAYDRGWIAASRAAVPVVCVGNLTLGGTGKTPMVEWIARWFRDRGARVALLSRGYGSSGGLNDEGLVLDRNLPDVPHLQDRDRVSLARIAVDELEAQVLVLDDGFQHRKLARDLDFVLLDALDPFGLGRLFPRGLLREPVGSLRRANLVVLSRADLVPEADRRSIRERAERAAGRPLPWAEATQRPIELMDAEGRVFPLGDLAGLPVAAFCGIGNPEGFRRTLRGLGVEPAAFRIFPDHHPYSRADADDLTSWARASGARLALTTQKDSVKLPIDRLGPVPLRALRIGLEVISGLEVLESALEGLLGRID